MKAKLKKFRYQAAIIEWLDAHARNQAVEYLETEVPALHTANDCTILALVIKDDEKGLSLYNEETGPDSIRGVSFIPRAMVKNVTYVDLKPIKAKPAPSHKSPAPSSSAPSPDLPPSNTK